MLFRPWRTLLKMNESITIYVDGIPHKINRTKKDLDMFVEATSDRWDNIFCGNDFVSLTEKNILRVTIYSFACS
jgi:hypothetical protein